MLFSSIGFMSRTTLGQWIIVVLVLTLKLNIASSSQIPNDYTDRFDGDFDNFLREMGTLVYKGPKTDVTRNKVRVHVSTPALPTRYFKNKKKNTPKSVLEDVLMMKLVSYYEDKYKLSPLEPTTTESITFNLNDRFNLNSASKKNLYKYNIIDNEEVLNAYRKPTMSVRYGLNRKKQKDMKRMNEMRESEVVVF